MKSKVNAEEYGKLSDDLKKEYDLEGSSGNYLLKIEGTTGADHPLFQARDNEKTAKENALRERDAARQERDTLKNKPPVNETEAEKQRREAWETEKREMEERHAKLLEEKDTALRGATADQELSKLASELFTKPGRDAVHLNGRLKVEVKDGKAEVIYLDKDGKGTTRDALKKEFLANKEYAGITVASQGSGGGAPPPGQGQGGGAPKPGDSGSPAAQTYVGMDSKSLVAAMKERGVGAGVGTGEGEA